MAQIDTSLIKQVLSEHWVEGEDRFDDDYGHRFVAELFKVLNDAEVAAETEKVSVLVDFEDDHIEWGSPNKVGQQAGVQIKNISDDGYIEFIIHWRDVPVNNPVVTMERLREEYVKLREEHHGFSDLYGQEWDAALAAHDRQKVRESLGEIATDWQFSKWTGLMHQKSALGQANYVTTFLRNAAAMRPV